MRKKGYRHGGKVNEMANDYDDSDLQENKKIAKKNKKTLQELMKKGKMAPEPEQDKPKIKLRCGGSKGYKKGGLVTKGKPKIAKKGWR